jgi:DNA-binding transcriptional regulator GbsR (MarR family)
MSQASIASARNLFIRRWGEMAARWGVSRTMAEIHALLYLSPDPLCTDDIMEQLAVSRGSASINLRELANWGLISRVHRRGDRKEYFEAEKDVWQMFETITRERRRREVQPIVETLEKCLAMVEEARAASSGPGRKEAEAFHRRFSDLLAFSTTMNVMFNLLLKTGRLGVRPLTRALGKITG